MRVLNFQSPYRQGETPYQIFKDRMAAISSISDGIRTIISNKYINKQNSMIAENIQNAIDEQKAIDLSNLILSDPPDEIYPSDPNIEDTVSQFVDKYVMGPMMKKETMMGGLPAVSGAAPTAAPTTEAMIPKTDMYQLYNVIKDLPTGQITWDNIYKKMTEKKPRFMGTTGPEEFVLNQMMGQVGDPRAKIASDINLANLVKEAFTPEEEKRPGKYPYTEEEVKEYELYKKSLEPPEEQIDFDKLNEFLEANDMKLSGVNVNPKTGNLSYSFNAKDTDKSWGEFLEEANKFMELNPDYEVTSTNPKTGSVTISKKGIPPGTTVKPPTYYVAENIEEGFMEKVENIQDFTNELNRLKGLNIDTSIYETTEYFAELMKKKHRTMMDFVKFAFDKMTAGEEIHEKTGKSYRDLYKEYWDKANSYDQQYFMVTGEHLLKGE